MKYCLYVLVAFIVSMGIFPFIPSWLPIANTKMVMAGIGLFVLGIQRSRLQDANVRSDFYMASIWAVVVSIAGIVSIMYNETKDYSYASYIVSMWVWCGSSYLILTIIKAVHGKLSLFIVANYLIVVCVAQCILALTMDSYPGVKSFIDSILIDDSFMGKMEGRLYGLGCSVDVAGSRFAAILVLVASICSDMKEVKNRMLLPLYLLAFLIIAIIGNMISRTTILGVGLAVVYWIYKSGMWRMTLEKDEKQLWKYLVLFLSITIPLVTHFYYSNPAFQQNLRFGFEGFFSIAEKGYWETNSNNQLLNMIRFPSELKTLIIGDGYFDNPLSTDPYYTGPGAGTFYMYTDIGYLRFIYYFGMIGLIALTCFFVNVTTVCIKKFKTHKNFFILLLILNMIIWCKVSSDLFPVFAIFLCITASDMEEAERLESEQDADIPKIAV